MNGYKKHPNIFKIIATFILAFLAIIFTIWIVSIFFETIEFCSVFLYFLAFFLIGKAWIIYLNSYLTKNHDLLNCVTVFMLIYWFLGLVAIWLIVKNNVLEKRVFFEFLIIILLNSVATWINYVIFCDYRIKVQTEKKCTVQLFLKALRIGLVAIATFFAVFIAFYENTFRFETVNFYNAFSYLTTLLPSFIYPILDLYEYTLNIIEKYS